MRSPMDVGRARELMYQTLCDSAGAPPPAQWEAFAAGFRLRTLAKATYLVHVGERTSQIAFVAEGLLRMVYLREDGREFNKTFVASRDFAGVLESLVTGEASRLSIQCLEETTVLEADYAHACSFYRQDVYWERFGRLFAERLYVRKARREAALLMDSPASRYRTFLIEYAQIAERVPDYHIASYLGVTPETLSRLRRTGRS